MNVLSLRINAVKSDNRFKKVNGDLLQFTVEDFWSKDIQQHLKLINDSMTTESQLKELKRFGKLISPENPKEQNEKIARKLIAVFFQEKLKHPAKSTIQSSFNQSLEQDLLVDCIKDEIKRRAESLSLESTEDCFHFITCLNEASQNFRPAIVAMGQHVSIIVKFISSLIDVYKSQLLNELSPAQKNLLCHRLHCSLQAVIFCFRNYVNGMFTNGNQKRKMNDYDSDVKQNLGKIFSTCNEFLDHPDVPMDTKNNCSILIVLYSRLWSHSEYFKEILVPISSIERRLSLIFGYINVVTPNFATFGEFLVIVEVISLLNKRSLDAAMTLSISRSVNQLSRKCVTARSSGIICDFCGLAFTVLYIALDNLEHHTDSVRHLSKETIGNVFIVCKNSDNTTMVDEFFDVVIKSLNPNQESTVIASLLPVISANEITEKLPDLPSSLLQKIEDNCETETKNQVDCYISLASKNFEEIPFETWFEKFAQPVIDKMTKHKSQNEKRLVFENLLVQFIKKEKKVLEEILKNREKFDTGFIFLCLSTSNKNGRFDKELSTSESWKGVVSFSEIKKAMVHADDNIRTSALMLIVETRKTVEGFSVQELECFIQFLKHNINVQSPSMRQSILGMVKNFFVRINSVLQWHIKKKKQESVEFYFNLLIQLQEFCLDNLFKGANFTRRSLSLRILFYIFEAVDKFFETKKSEFWNQTKFDVLMNVLNDSYEANKEMAIEIMKFIPKTNVKEFTSMNLQQLKEMATSIKPPESLTASYLMEIMAKFTLNLDKFNGEKSETFPEMLCMLTWCENILLEGLDVAEKSLKVASSTNPLYGLVLATRHLISKTDLKLLGGCHLWKEYFDRLLKICKRLTLVVAPVVNNSSPEGILPQEECQCLDEKTKEEWSKIMLRTTPQIILLCSWRIIKEVSLLLGEICLKAPLINDGIGLLDVEQILSIGDHFLELLAKTKHRGAFEQCFFGFSQLCLRLWVCQEPELHKLPSQMLHQMITSISGVEKENSELLTMKNLCATRRSAGLPFMIQALITSELKVSTNKNFHFVMKNLIQFCKHGEYLETRTHSLNILRSLFRCSDLNEAISEYIAEGMKCAILGYGAESWIERNSSTLLFSSLMVRIFGVQRTKDSDEINIKNKMTGRLFFFRYPELYDFFMEQLNEAADHVKVVKMNAKLHPLLMLLIRLYPSAKDGSENKLELSSFIPVVSMCSGCVEMQTRILCARFIASVLSPELNYSRIIQTIDILRESRKLPANIAHGILLQVLYLVKLLPHDENNLTNLFSILKEICAIGKSFKKQLVCYGTFLEIVIEACGKVWHMKENHKKELLKYFDTCIDLNDSNSFGTSIVNKKFFLIKLMKFTINSNIEFIINMTPTTLILNVILLILDFDYALCMQEEYEINSKEVFIFKGCHINQRSQWKEKIRNDKSLKEMLKQIISSNRDKLIVVKSLDILSLMEHEKEDADLEQVKQLISNALNKPEHLKKSSLKYANSCVKAAGFDAQIDFKFLVELSTDASFFVKSSVTDFVTTIASNFSSVKSFNTMLYFSKSVLLLLMDDEEEIRDRNMKVVMQIVGDSERKVVPVYAQEIFIEFLITKLDNFNKLESMALVLLIVIDGSEGDNRLDEHIAEYRVFDKNEVNIFGENFIIKRMCLKMLQRELERLTSPKEEVALIVEACGKYDDCDDLAGIKDFILNLI